MFYRVMYFVLALAAAVSVAIVLYFEFIFKPCDLSQVLWRTSPNRQFKAFVVEERCGMTVPPSYEIVVRDYKENNDKASVTKLNNSRRSDSSYGVNICWIDGNTLEVSYFSAEIMPIAETAVTINGKTVNIQYRPDVYDVKAPPGHMARALQNFSYLGMCNNAH